jgi:ferredoxin
VPVVELLASPAGSAVRVEGDGPLVDLCDEARAPVLFSCRGASCGTCRVEVLEGAHLLEPPHPDEVAVLQALAAPCGVHRLACQAVVRAGPGLILLRWRGR